MGTGLATVAILLSFVYCFFWFYSFDVWTIDILIHLNAFRISEFFTVWSPHNYDNVTDSLWDSIADHRSSALRWSVGVCGLAVNLFGSILDHLMCDVILLITLSLSHAMNGFIKNVRQNGRQASLLDNIWQEYEYMKKLAMDINNLFGMVLLLMHANNALMISHLLIEGLNQDTSISTILHTLTAAKVLVIYFIAAKTSGEVSIYKHWNLCFKLF